MRRGRWADDPEALRRSARDRRDPDGGAASGSASPGPTSPVDVPTVAAGRRLLPGVVLLGSGPATRRQRDHRGADLRRPGRARDRPGGVPTARGAPRTRSAGRRSTCSCPTSGSSRASEFVVVERTTRLPPPTRARRRAADPRCPRLPRRARRLHSAAEITELIADTVQRRLCTPAQLAAELREGSQRGSATPRRVLVDVSDGSADRRPSATPSVWWRAAACPRRGGTCRCTTHRGRLLGIADAWFDEVALAWEINSYAWHLNRRSPTPGRSSAPRTDGREGRACFPVLPTALHATGDGSLADARRPPTPRPHGVPVLRCGPIRALADRSPM